MFEFLLIRIRLILTVNFFHIIVLDFIVDHFMLIYKIGGWVLVLIILGLIFIVFLITFLGTFYTVFCVFLVFKVRILTELFYSSKRQVYKP